MLRLLIFVDPSLRCEPFGSFNHTGQMKSRSRSSYQISPLGCGGQRSDDRRSGPGGHPSRTVPYGTSPQYRFALLQGWAKAAPEVELWLAYDPPCPRGRPRPRGHGGTHSVPNTRRPGRLCPPYNFCDSSVSRSSTPSRAGGLLQVLRWLAWALEMPTTLNRHPGRNGVTSGAVAPPRRPAPRNRTRCRHRRCSRARRG